MNHPNYFYLFSPILAKATHSIRCRVIGVFSPNLYILEVIGKKEYLSLQCIHLEHLYICDSYAPKCTECFKQYKNGFNKAW